MTLMHADPWFRNPFRELDRLSSRLFTPGFGTATGAPMDVHRDDRGYHVDIDLPGVDPQDIDVTVERSMVTVRATRQPCYGDTSEVILAERPSGQLLRQFTLGDDVDSEALDVAYRNGVLHFTIPVSASTQPRRLQVNSGSTAGSGQGSVGVNSGVSGTGVAGTGTGSSTRTGAGAEQPGGGWQGDTMSSAQAAGGEQ